MSELNQPVAEPGTDPNVEPGIDLTVQPKTEPETDPAGELGTDPNQQKTVESPEDIAIARAHFQTLAQEKAEALKAVQEELDAIKGTVTTPIVQPAVPGTPAVTQEQETTPVTEFDDDELLTPAALQKILDARDRQKQAEAAKAKQAQAQAEVQQRWNEENDRAESALNQIQKKYKLSDEVVDAAIERAKLTLNLPPQLGLAEARLRLVKQDLSNHIVQARTQGAVTTQLATDQQKVTDAAQLAQPVTGAIDPQVKEVTEQERERIAPTEDKYTVM